MREDRSRRSKPRAAFGNVARTCLVALLLTMLLASTFQRPARAMADAAPAATCAVTLPNGDTPPGERPSPNHHGDGRLWTALPVGGVVIGLPDGHNPAGPPVATKWPWWRGVSGSMTIDGRRLDGPAPPLRSDVPPNYGDTGFQATGLVFPGEGCWRVTAHVAAEQLSFVVRVVVVDEPQIAGGSDRRATPGSASACPVTLPGASTPSSGSTVEPGWHGTRDLSVALPPDGIERHPADSALADGALVSVWIWRRGLSGPLSLEGHWYGDPADRLPLVVPPGFIDVGRIATVLFFPAPGCWQVTGTVRDRWVSVTVWVETM